jgi:hypothetical protein
MSGESDKSDIGDKMDEQDIRDGLAEMAQNDLDLPYQAFCRALVNAGIPDEEYQDVMSALSVQIGQFRENQVKYTDEVYFGQS